MGGTNQEVKREEPLYAELAKVEEVPEKPPDLKSLLRFYGVSQCYVARNPSYFLNTASLSNAKSWIREWEK